MIGNLGFSETVVIGTIALIVLGPRRLPELARTLGRTLARFRHAADDLKETVEREVDLADTRAALASVTKGLDPLAETPAGVPRDRPPSTAATGELTAPPTPATPATPTPAPPGGPGGPAAT